jgi:hypothetical protein
MTWQFFLRIEFASPSASAADEVLASGLNANYRKEYANIRE